MGVAWDVVIRNALIYDGTGAAPLAGDVALRDTRIARVGRVGAGGAKQELDARGMALAPGFIDVHTHDDFAAVLYPDMGFKLLGGVTSCVVGNCGMGAAPHAEASILARAFHPHHELPTWEGYAGYLAYLERHPPSVNIGALVGHGTLRLAAMRNERRRPQEGELALMRQLLREGLEAGALGFSTGLIYEPGCHADTDEIVELARLMHETGGLYATHMRNEGSRLIEALEEAIEIGERAGVPVQISHHKASGRENWGLVTESLKRIEAARSRGLELHADQYPYTAGSTVLAAVLRQGSFDPRGGGLGSIKPSDIVIASTANHPEWEGLSIADLEQDLGLPAQQAAQQVLDAEPGATVIMHTMSEDDVQTVMRHPSTMIGSDGIPTLEGKPHPRLYGSFARVLGRYARDLALFPLQEGIHRMTGLAAAKFRLADRGEIREDAFADLVIFDAGSIIDRGTYEDPHHHPRGISHIFVNGTHVVRDGQHTGLRPGQVLRPGDVAA